MFLEWEKVKDSLCSMVVIVGPYPTKGFIEKVINRLKPKSIFVVVDESWKPAEIEKIKRVIGEDNVILIRTSDGQGIVHAKMYFVEYERERKKMRRLFFGSINASINSEKNNSEFINSFKLATFSPDNQTKIKKYFDALTNRKRVFAMRISEKVGKDGGRFSLNFPQIDISRPIKSFYNWLRSGSFFVKYETDSNFGSLTVKLNKKRVPKGEFEKLLKGSIFENNILKNELRYPYAGKIGKIPQERWKKYTVETNRGLWASYECCCEKKIPPISASRKKTIEKIGSLTKSEIHEKAQSFCEEIADLQKKSKILKQCLKMPNLERLERKIENDVLLANDATFTMQYKTGYSKISLLTNNASELKSISSNFVESCLRKTGKQKIENLMARLIMKRFGNRKAAEIRKKLLNSWDEYKNELTQYYIERK